MKNKKGLVMGVANQKSIAWGIAEVLSAEGASLALTYQGENFKKRVAQEKSQAASYVKDSIFRDLLNFIDNFERGLSLYKEKEGGTDFFKGMEAVFKECDNFLTKNSINRIEVKLGDDFNPSIHEAIEVKNSNDFSKDKIVRTFFIF